MDKAKLFEFINRDMADMFVAGLIKDMSSRLTDEEFKECMRNVFAEIAKRSSDYEYEVERAIENTRFDIESAYYDDEDDDDLVPSAGPNLKNRYDFVKIMFAADLDEEAIEICNGISEGLLKVSQKKKYERYQEDLTRLRLQMLDCMEKKEYAKWFEH
ncbi:MAG: hypothetical protein E7Z62_00695 [Thermoplasmata archaeon]|jgi:hypothetical protein|nr:hypothetical protein [Thermoplasmata archaeon]